MTLNSPPSYEDGVLFLLLIELQILKPLREEKFTAGLPAVKERRMEISVSGIDDFEIGVGCQFVYDAIEYSKDQIYSSCNNQ